MSDHEWCRDVRRDEKVRAAEDAAAVPSIQHRDLPEQVALVWASLGDLLGRVVRLEGEMDAGQDEEAAPAVCDSASPAEGLRTERVTLEITHGINSRPVELATWVRSAVSWKLHTGESVRVVDETTIGSGDVFRDVGCGSTGDEIDRLTAERDAAIRERDEAKKECERLRAKIVAMEGQSRMETEAEIAVEEAWERCRIAPHWPDDEPGTSHRYAKSMEAEIVRLRACVAELEAEQADAEPVAWREHVEEMIRSWWSPTCNEDGDRANLEQFIGEDMLDSLLDYVLDEGKGPPPPRGWLTAEEREAIRWAMSEGLDEDVFSNLLARNSPPKVRLPSAVHNDILAALAAAGVEVEE